VRALARLEGWLQTPRLIILRGSPKWLAPQDDGPFLPAREDRRVSKSSTTISRSGLLPNPHPGEILLEEFLKPMGLSQNALARSIHVAPRRINEIVLGKRDVTADTDLRLARYFGLSEGFFLGLQMDYDLMQRRREIDRDLKTIRPRAA
jgi:addiction module HigA family antidote